VESGLWRAAREAGVVRAAVRVGRSAAMRWALRIAWKGGIGSGDCVQLREVRVGGVLGRLEERWRRDVARCEGGAGDD